MINLKNYFLFSGVVIVGILGLHALLPLQFYSVDSHYFWGLAHYILEGKLQNSLIFWHIYPLFFAFPIAAAIFVFPSLSYTSMALGLLILLIVAGPLIFHRAYRELKLSFPALLFYFFFAMSGFYVVEYLVGETLVPQALGFLLLALFPALLFSKKKHDVFLALLLLVLIYFMHSATAFFILLATALSIFWKPTRKRVWLISLLLAPFLLLKALHLGLLLGGVDIVNLPFNNFLQSLGLSTWDHGITDLFRHFSLYQFVLSGVPFFFWVLFLPFIKNKFRHPVVLWFVTLFLVSLFAFVAYDLWTELFHIGWPRDRYLGFLWLSFALTLPYGLKRQSRQFKTVFIPVAIFFIVFQFGMGFYRETRVQDDTEQLQAWINGLSQFVDEEDGPILFLVRENNPKTYAYSFYAPHDIYFSFPYDINKNYLINRRTDPPGFSGSIPSQEEIEAILLDENIPLVVFIEEFKEPFDFLQDSPQYEFVSSFQNEFHAYQLSPN